MSSRPVIKASRQTKALPDLTGKENIKYVESNRLYNYGYKKFLYSEKILELFGERIAKSKKIRKAKIREILHKIMHTFDLKTDFDENAIVDDFIQKTEDNLRGHIAEIQAMKSSSINTQTVVKQKGKRKKVSKDENSSDIKMDVVVSKEKVPEINPIENQLDFLVELMKTTTDPSKPSIFSARQVEAKFKTAQDKDKEAIKKAEAEKERQKKVEKRRKIVELNKEIRDDLTILLEKTRI